MRIIDMHVPQAYREGILYPKYMFITYGWYDAGWWKASNGSFYNCTGEEIAKVLRYTLISVIQENPVDPGFIADPGFVSLAKSIMESTVLCSLLDFKIRFN